MKKSFLIILILLSVVYFGCEKDFDSLVDQSPSSFQVIGLRSIDTVRFIPGDSLLLMTITFNDVRDLKSTTSDIYSSAGSKLNSSSINLFDNGRPENGDQTSGDKTYSNKFPLSQANPNGLYTIRYFALDKNNVTKQVAIQNFNYDNGQANVAPVISNLSIPDTVVRNISFIFSVFVADSNGLNDIEFVYFELFRPDGSQVFPSPGVTKFLMHDDGNFDVFGDQTPGDGIYSFKNLFANTAQTGEWKFIFQAIDRRKNLSNPITHFLQVK
jgi:hypothetical protein